jgi:hypothetical protein
MHPIPKLMAVVALLLLAACQSSSQSPPPPGPDSLVAKVPALFKHDLDAYVILVKNDARAITGKHNLTFDGIGPIVIATQELIVWKVAPGIHVISHAFRQGDKALRVEVFEGNRVVFEVDGNGGLFIRSFANDWDKLAANPNLAGYHDMSDQPPPEPLGRRR